MRGPRSFNFGKPLRLPAASVLVVKNVTKLTVWESTLASFSMSISWHRTGYHKLLSGTKFICLSIGASKTISLRGARCR